MNDKFSKPYNPKDVEEKIYKLWEESGFNPDKLPNQEDREKKENIPLCCLRRMLPVLCIWGMP